MSHLPMIASLTVIALVSWAGVVLAADPTKVPPKLSPSRTPKAKFVRPDLAPMKLAGDKIVTGFNFRCVGNELWVGGFVMNSGTDRGGSFKVLVRVNGTVWSIPGNPYTFAAGPLPGSTIGYEFRGWAPGPGPIPGKVLVSVEVDSEHTVLELNENNNVATIKMMPCK